MIFHDSGKPFVQCFGDDGKRHFPNHAEASYKAWIEHGGSLEAAELIRRDMEIHLLKAEGIDEFIVNKQHAIILLIAGLCEIHSNSSMFGGIESTSFKIKWKQIDKRGKSICQRIFG